MLKKIIRQWLKDMLRSMAFIKYSKKKPIIIMKMAPVSSCVWAFKRTLFHREPNV